jgi:hypothetical protein
MCIKLDFYFVFIIAITFSIHLLVECLFQRLSDFNYSMILVILKGVLLFDATFNNISVISWRFAILNIQGFFHPDINVQSLVYKIGQMFTTKITHC